MKVWELEEGEEYVIFYNGMRKISDKKWRFSIIGQFGKVAK